MKQITIGEALFRDVAWVARAAVERHFRAVPQHWDDMEQAALVAIWLAVDAMRSAKGTPRTFAWTVAYRAACSELRRIRAVEAESLETDVPREAGDPDTSGWLFKQIPKREAQALALVHVWGFSDWEAAKRLSMKRPAFRALLSGAQACARAAVEGEAA